MFSCTSQLLSLFFVGCFMSQPLTPTLAHYYGGPPYYSPWRHYHLPPRPRSPVDIMTDALNSVGTRILQQYVEPGNVAFSPAGVGFILAALYEGSAGRSRQQITDCLGLPRDRQVVRVGLRDIHARLRTYLNPDGFLGGLNLNRENTQLRPDFEIVLQFYGFDLTSDLSNFTSNNGTNFGLQSSLTTTTLTPGQTMMPATMGVTVPSTTTPMSAAAGMVGGAGQTMAPSTTTTAPTTTMLPTTNPATTTMPPTTSQAPQMMVSAQMAAASEIVTVSTQLPTMTTQQPTTTTDIPTGALISSTLPRIMTTTQSSVTEAVTTTTTMPPTTTTEPSTTTDLDGEMDTTTFAEDLAPVIPPSGVRRRRSNDYFSNFPDDGLWMQDLNIWADQAPLPTDQRDATELQFLVNGCEPATVPAATYTNVLPFAYFPSLKSIGLEFPLDNPRYNVLLFLPTDRVDTSRLSRDLAGQNLRQLRKHLQPTWVRATIPSFTLRGFVTLTPFLQRLGVRDVFEPRLADLSPMTPDLGVYARDVQQSIAVNIRNYMSLGRDNSTANSTNGNQASNQAMGQMPAQPQRQQEPPRSAALRFPRPANDLLDKLGLVSFTAGHPFLFFIIDSETSVALIAGRIEDPLNSRIL